MWSTVAGFARVRLSYEYSKTPDMNFTLEEDGRPKYQRMVDHVERMIREGHWKEGDKLPSNRELTIFYGVTMGTVSRAMSEAVRRGVVETRVGSGTYVLGQTSPAVTPAYAGANPFAGTIDLSLNVLPGAPSRPWIEQLIKKQTVQAGIIDSFQYTDVQHSERYRQLGAHWLTQFGTPCAAEQVVITQGVHHGLVAALSTLLRRGDTALCDTLNYVGVQRIAETLGVNLVGVDADHEGICPERLEKAINATGARVLIVTPYMHNPMAYTLSDDRLGDLAKLGRKYNLWIIEDGVNLPLTYAGNATLAARLPDQTIHLSGLSKCISTGFRLGYAYVPGTFLPRFTTEALSFQWFIASMYPELHYLMHEEGLIQTCLQAQQREASLRQKLVREWLPQARADSVGYHVWLPCDTDRPSSLLYEQVRREGVLLSAAHHFAVDPNHPHPDGVRISLGAAGSINDVRQGLEIIARVLHAPTPSYNLQSAPVV